MEKNFFYVTIFDPTCSDELTLCITREDFEVIGLFKFVELGFKVEIIKART